MKTYSQLRKKIQTEIEIGRRMIARVKAQTYWAVGKHIHEHVSQFQRAERTEQLMIRLAHDLDMGSETLYKSVEFYRTFPHFVPQGHLGWGHYRKFLGINDKRQREKLIAKTIAKKWTNKELAQEIRRLKLKTTFSRIGFAKENQSTFFSSKP